MTQIIGHIINLNKLYEDYQLPHWSAHGLNKADLSKKTHPSDVRQYLSNHKYPVQAFKQAMMVVKRTRKPDDKKHYFQATVPIMIEILFHDSSTYKFEEAVTEKPKRNISENRKQQRTGKQWYDIKSTLSPFFEPNEKYKTSDEMAMYATEEEIRELLKDKK